MAWIYYLALMGAGVVGLFVNIMGLPGLWLMVCSALVYWMMTGELGVWGFLVIFVLAILAEVFETLLGGLAAKQAGGSKRAMIGAVIGGILGAIVGTGLIPIPIVGTIVGACIGSFVLAFAVELVWLKRSARESLAVGKGAAAGKLVGIVSKSVVGVVMLLILAAWAWPSGGAISPPTAPVLPPPTTTSVSAGT